MFGILVWNISISQIIMENTITFAENYTLPLQNVNSN